MCLRRVSIYIFILFSISTINLSAQNNADLDSIKVLYVGNSFTGWNAMPFMVEELANNTNHSIYTDQLLSYGRSLYQISELDKLRQKVRNVAWDYIIIQDSPYRFAYPDEFSDVYPINVAFHRIKTLVSEYRSTTKIVLFMPWAYEDGKFWDENEPDDYFEMQAKVRDRVIVLANSYEFNIAPVGWAWDKALRDSDSIDLFIDDFTHPTIDGSYLTACVIFSTLFNEELSSNEFHSDLPADLAVYLQKIASEVVMEESEVWNIITNVKENLITHFSLSQNYPNPFNAQTTISFELVENGNVSLEIFNGLGKKVVTLINKHMYSGTHNINYNANNLPSGVYFYRIKVSNNQITKSMIFLK